MSKKEALNWLFDNVKSYLYAFNASPSQLPISIEDSIGVNAVADYKIDVNKITVNTSRGIESDSRVNLYIGANPQYVIIDSRKQLPIVCFKNVIIE